MHSLEGQHVVITGASGGVGVVAVKNFLQAGCKVTAQVNSNLTSLAPLECENLEVIKCNITSEHSVQEFFVSVTHGPIDILILNHGYFRSDNIPVAEMSLEDWQSTIDINLTGSFLFARSFLRQVRKEFPVAPKICIVGSTAGKYGEAYQ